MKIEKTWAPKAKKQTVFVWDASTGGIHIAHCNSTKDYVIPWNRLYEVLRKIRSMAKSSNPILVGTSMTNPPKGSLGDWVKNNKLPISKGQLTPRHLSFLGPILGTMGTIVRVVKKNNKSIYWKIL